MATVQSVQDDLGSVQTDRIFPRLVSVQPADTALGYEELLWPQACQEMLDMEEVVARDDLLEALDLRVMAHLSPKLANRWAYQRVDEFAETLKQLHRARQLLDFAPLH